MEIVDFTKFCLFTKSKENLTTKMDIEHEGKLYKVAICDAAADKASIKRIKIKLISVLKEINILISRAEVFGLHVSTSKVIPQRIVPVSTQASSDVTEAPKVQKIMKADMVGEVQPITIPKSLSDKHGTMNIDIVKTNNKDLLNQNALYNNTDFRNGYAQNTQTKTCPACKGAGVVKISNSVGIQEIPCKKCDQLGIIP